MKTMRGLMWVVLMLACQMAMGQYVSNQGMYGYQGYNYNATVNTSAPLYTPGQLFPGTYDPYRPMTPVYHNGNQPVYPPTYQYVPPASINIPVPTDDGWRASHSDPYRRPEVVVHNNIYQYRAPENTTVYPTSTTYPNYQYQTSYQYPTYYSGCNWGTPQYYYYRPCYSPSYSWPRCLNWCWGY